ncbi:MAG: hypothetical protein CFE44_01805 [Burkholderiales bacterium PBB4]|nr:MAG: hypothetical protein CFE44_01805 [Burkholderiales bacterium PBB4]
MIHQRQLRMRDWERYVLLTLLGPLLWLQAKHVRRVTPRLPEPEGQRQGEAGQGPLVRVLVAGDSAAAGVGVSHQDEALCGQLVQRLSRHRTVQWCLLAANGLDSPGLIQLLEETPHARFDVVVVSMGVNDATSLRPPRQWLQWQHRLAQVVEQRFAPNLLVHNAVPPMHAFTALPQPLRWFMGRWAKEMNHQLVGGLQQAPGRTIHWLPIATAAEGLASDGFHPGARGYALWAESLSERILAATAVPANIQSVTAYQ